MWFTLILIFALGPVNQDAGSASFLELARIDPASLYGLPEAKRCGEFFLEDTSSPGNPKIVFFFRMEQDGHLVSSSFALQSENFRTVLDDFKSRPILEYILPPSGKIGQDLRATVRLSRAEYEKAKTCLPPPK